MGDHESKGLSAAERSDSTPYPDGTILDAEKQDYENNFDDFAPSSESERASLIAAAKKGRPPISVRLDSADIAALKRLAEREGLPCQTLLRHCGEGPLAQGGPPRASPLQGASFLFVHLTY